MCGIFGFLGSYSRSFDQLLLDLNTGLTRIRHRGPDGTGKWVSDDGQVALGHVRLSIIDLETGAQPMHSEEADTPSSTTVRYSTTLSCERSWA